jgi:hypothetical protein
VKIGGMKKGKRHFIALDVQSRASLELADFESLRV